MPDRLNLAFLDIQIKNNPHPVRIQYEFLFFMEKIGLTFLLLFDKLSGVKGPVGVQNRVVIDYGTHSSNFPFPMRFAV